MGSFLSSRTEGVGSDLANTTRETFDTYIHNQLQVRNDDYRRQIDLLLQENKALRRYNKHLQKKQLNTQPGNVTAKTTKTINTLNIKQYVDDMLQNQDNNIYGFPDAIEKQIYRNVFNMILDVLDHTLKESEIVLFGHKIIFDIKPLDQDIIDETNRTST